MTAKLHINILEGVLNIEGDPALVREIYTDFKAQLVAGGTRNPPPPSREEREGTTGVEEGDKPRTKAKRRAPSRKRANGDDAGPAISADAPKLDKSLDTSKLATFYGEFEAKNNFEKILIFLKFITEELGIENPNTDQVYTCYKKTGDKIPKAFAQAFRDTSTKHGYIDFRSPTDIAITIAGDNHFNHGLKKKGVE